ncbi:hypothetical protein D6D25_09563, partial [Aureobasidium pullulans]
MKTTRAGSSAPMCSNCGFLWRKSMKTRRCHSLTMAMSSPVTPWRLRGSGILWMRWMSRATGRKMTLKASLTADQTNHRPSPESLQSRQSHLSCTNAFLSASTTTSLP